MVVDRTWERKVTWGFLVVSFIRCSGFYEMEKWLRIILSLGEVDWSKGFVSWGFKIKQWEFWLDFHLILLSFPLFYRQPKCASYVTFFIFILSENKMRISVTLKILILGFVWSDAMVVCSSYGWLLVCCIFSKHFLYILGSHWHIFCQ